MKLLGLLSRYAAKTIKTFYQEMTGKAEGVPGVVISVQTFGNHAGNYNPHCHCLVTDGVYLSDGSSVRSSFIPPVDIEELFRRDHEILRVHHRGRTASYPAPPAQISILACNLAWRNSFQKQGIATGNLQRGSLAITMTGLPPASHQELQGTPAACWVSRSPTPS